MRSMFANTTLRWTTAHGKTAVGRIVAVGVAALCWVAVPLTDAQESKPAQSALLFDGQTLEGWEGNLEFFRVEDGAVVAGNLKTKIPRNEFLCTKQRFGDFELTLKVKVIGEGANAGIQIRSERIPNHHEVSGYQADVGAGWWAKLYDESRRKKVLAAPKDTEEYQKHVKLDDWNDYRIRCEGKRVQLWINGFQTVDFEEYDDTIPREGIIGLQIHGGPPSEAWYKDIRIAELNREGTK